MLALNETTELLLTHTVIPAGPIPTSYDPDGIYPYESFCETSRRPEIRRYRIITMENERIRVKVCTDLGGRVCSLFLKQARSTHSSFRRWCGRCAFCPGSLSPVGESN